MKFEDYQDWSVSFGSHFSPPEVSDDCYECKCFGYFYVYKNRTDFVEGSHYTTILVDGKPITHKNLYKIITRMKKLERIVK